MSWAGNRRLGITLVVVLAVCIVLGVTLALVLPQKPTCSDGVWNQDETGVDCGGSCAYLCKASVVEPTASFVRALSSSGRVDVVGLVENRNLSAQVKDAAYAIDLYAPDGSPLASIKGRMDLPAGESVPLFIPGVMAAGSPIGKVFLSFDEDSLKWVTAAGGRALPRADAIRVGGSVAEPRVTANLFNPTAFALKNVTVIATVYDASGAVIAATKTLAQSIGPEASVPLTFSWNEPFTSTPGKVTVQAVVPIP